MTYPTIVPAVSIYAGDTLDFPIYTFKTDATPFNFVADNWSDWVAQWRPTPESSEVIDLIVDDSQANVGIIFVSATAAQTALMGEHGVWDLQATQFGLHIRTWLRGATVYAQDVSRG